MFELRVLGAVEARTMPEAGHAAPLTQPKRLALLLYLALAEPAGLHSREKLLALFWPDADDLSARHSLRNGLHALRQALGDDAIVTRGESYVGVNFAAVRCDALVLRDHLAAGSLEEGLALWAGDIAPGFYASGVPEFEHWLDAQRLKLHREVLSAAWQRARELQGAGQPEVDAVRRAVNLNRGDEQGVRLLMRLLEQTGDRAAALREFEALSDYLARELQAEPSAETRALATMLRAEDAPERSPRPRTVPPMLLALERDAGARSPGTEISSGGVPTPAAPRRASARPFWRGLFAAGVLALAVSGLIVRREAQPHSPQQLDAPASQTETERAVLRLPARYRADTSLYHSYLRGLSLRFEFNFLASRDTLAALYRRGPDYVPGLFGLAHAYAFIALNDLESPDEAWSKVEQLSRFAIALDSTAGSPWLTLASKEMYEDLDLQRARGYLERARVLDSLDPDVAGVQSVWFRQHRDLDSAVAQAQLAHKLDPMSKSFDRLVAKQLYFARRYEESKTVYLRMLGEDRTWERGYDELARLYLVMGDPRAAVESQRRGRLAGGDSVGAAAMQTVSTDSAAVRLLAADARRTLAMLDRSAAARQPGTSLRRASLYAILGDTLSTFRWLDSLVTRHDGSADIVRLDPLFDFLRSAPRYKTWEARTGLPPVNHALGGPMRASRSR